MYSHRREFLRLSMATAATAIVAPHTITATDPDEEVRVLAQQESRKILVRISESQDRHFEKIRNLELIDLYARCAPAVQGYKPIREYTGVADIESCGLHNALWRVLKERKLVQTADFGIWGTAGELPRIWRKVFMKNSQQSEQHNPETSKKMQEPSSFHNENVCEQQRKEMIAHLLATMLRTAAKREC